MDITSIANAGFLIRAANKKVLIDALFGGFEADWCDVPDAQFVEKLGTAAVPFDQVDAILVTHAHLDHFNTGIVLNHLESNPAGLLVCPELARLELEEDGRFERLRGRIREITPAMEGGSQTINLNGMRITILRLKHSTYYEKDEKTGRTYNKHKDVQNLGFIIDMDGIKIFHGGDWAYDGGAGQPNPLREQKVDVAFLGIGAYLRLYGPGSRRIDRARRPENIILMHIPPGVNMDELNEEEKETLQGTLVFGTPMQTRRFGEQGTAF